METSDRARVTYVLTWRGFLEQTAHSSRHGHVVDRYVTFGPRSPHAFDDDLEIEYVYIIGINVKCHHIERS